MGNCLKGITESNLLEPLISSPEQSFEEQVLEKINKLESDLENTKANVLVLETNTYKNLQLISEDLNYINEKINERSGELSPNYNNNVNNDNNNKNSDELTSLSKIYMTNIDNDMADDDTVDYSPSDYNTTDNNTTLKSSDCFLSTASIN